MKKMTERRDFLKGAGVALTTSIFTGAVKGANDRISLLSELPHRLSIETKLLRKASLIQLEHRL